MTNLIANGDFEAGNITGWTVTYATGYEPETSGTVDARASAAQGGTAYGMYCRVVCVDYHRFEYITSAPFLGTWSKIEFWYNVTEHYLTLGAGNLIELDVNVTATGTGGYFEGLEFYRDTNNSDALEGWQKITIYRSDIAGLTDLSVCTLKFTFLVTCSYGASSRGTVNFDNIVVTSSASGGSLGVGSKAIVLPALGGKRIVI